jgi:hypothetical protein
MKDTSTKEKTVTTFYVRTELFLRASPPMTPKTWPAVAFREDAHTGAVALINILAQTKFKVNTQRDWSPPQGSPAGVRSVEVEALAS